MDIKVKIISENGMTGIVPTRGSEESSGMDVFVPRGYESQNKTELKPLESVVIPLNIIIDIPKGRDLEVKNRSGIASKSSVIKGAELIDRDYLGNIKINLLNLGSETFQIKDGMKIAQLVMRRVELPNIVVVEEIERETERGSGGFGSTGMFDKGPEIIPGKSWKK